jgi:hypothetical protein
VEEPPVGVLEIGSVPDKTVPATSKSGAVVSYVAPVASDGDDVAPPPVVVCTPASGSLFPVGTTMVTCTATDPDETPSEPAEVSTSFRVTVTPLPPQHSQCRERVRRDVDGHSWKPSSPSPRKDTHRSSDRDYQESWWDRADKYWRGWRN